MSTTHKSSNSDSPASIQCRGPQPPPSKDFTATTSTGKRPRGRPPGTKNKTNTKAITEPMDNYVDESAKLVVMDVPNGHDIMEYIADLARRENMSVMIHNGSGSIARATLRRMPRDSIAFTHHGPFAIVSFTGCYAYNTPLPYIAFGINLCTSQGQLFGGAVSGKVIADKDVSLTLSTFKNPEIHFFPPPNEINHDNNHDNDVNNNMRSTLNKMQDPS